MRGTAISVDVLEAPDQTRIGRFGWKNSVATLLSFSAGAYLNEMGITSPLLPRESTSLGRSVAFADTVADLHQEAVSLVVEAGRCLGRAGLASDGWRKSEQGNENRGPGIEVKGNEATDAVLVTLDAHLGAPPRPRPATVRWSWTTRPTLARSSSTRSVARSATSVQ